MNLVIVALAFASIIVVGVTVTAVYDHVYRWWVE